MINKVMDTILAICIMFIIPVCFLLSETERLKEAGYEAAIGKVMESIQCQGFIGEQHYERMSMLAVKLHQPQLQLWYYPETEQVAAVPVTKGSADDLEKIYQGEKVVALKTGMLVEWRSGKQRGLIRIRSGLWEREGGSAAEGRAE